MNHDDLHDDCCSSRRNFLLTTIGACSIPWMGVGCGSDGGGSPRSEAGGQVFATSAGCYHPRYANNPAGAIDCGVVPSFGDFGFDQRFASENLIQSTFFGMRPTVSPWNDCTSPNALSHPLGFILYGINFANFAIMRTLSELPIAGVLAHEYAHQLQFYFNWMNPTAPTVRDSELEADAFSGYYMALAKGWAGAQLQSYFDFIFSLGEYNFNNPNHHGTPNQRLAAAYIGFNTGLSALQFQYQYSAPELHQIFVREIQNALGAGVFSQSTSGNTLRDIVSGNRDLSDLDNPYAHLKSSTLWPRL